MTGIPTFSLLDPLPSGLLALEASAGTGKTYTLAGLTTRFIAEGRARINDLCLVTFTEAATAELRDRVRSRLVESLAFLERDGAPDEADDDVLRAIATPDALERSARITRLRAAVTDFDLAAISTIHGFCSRVLGIAALETGERRLVDGDDEIADALNDVFVRRYLDRGRPTLEYERFTEVTRALLGNPEAGLGRPGTTDPVVLDAIEAVREAADAVRARRTAAGTRSFDDLIHDTWELVAKHPDPAFLGELRRRFRVVLVDEFQDTDSLQWGIFRAAFVHPEATVVVVGDPKQAIYRFRSADIVAYVDAVETADDCRNLPVNRRSDPALLDALDVVFRAASFGGPSIRFSRVEPAPGLERQALSGGGLRPFRIRVVPTGGQAQRAARATSRILKDLVAEVVGLLEGDARLRGAPVQRRDIAVLTRNNDDARAVARALVEAGIQAATSSTDSVLKTEAADQWAILLRALERPSSTDLARTAALGWFLGVPAQELATLDDDGLGLLHDRLHRWADTLRRTGLPGLLGVARSEGLHQRLLGRPGGDRSLTDLEHIAEVLQRHAESNSPAALLGVVDRLGAVADDADLLARRIDTDDEAVQVLTIHRSKGLEFPIVLCPFLWRSRRPGGLQTGHDPEVGGRVIDVAHAVGGKDPVIKAIHEQECADEDLRLLYVALTRARHHCVVWWPRVVSARAKKPTEKGPLGRILFSERSPDGSLGTIGPSVGTPDDETALRRLEALAAHAPGTIAVEVVADRAKVEARPSAAPTGLGVAPFGRVIPDWWRTWSFTGMKPVDDVGAPGVVVVTERGAEDETGTDEPSPDDTVAVAKPAGPLAGLPGGTVFGSLVHDVLEHTDFASDELEADLLAAVEAALRRRPVPVDPVTLAHGLAVAVRSPLGGPLGDVALAGLTRGDRLDELAFDLPFVRGPGASADAGVGLHDIGRVVSGHLPPDDPALPYFALLADSPSSARAGQLHGSIDLVFRTDRTAEPRVWVVDYKTNHLRSGYGQAELQASMARSHYLLQAAIYLTATHRYLRWRQPGYRAEAHLGGVAYLYVRGMAGGGGTDGTGAAPDGVFWWQPPAPAVVALSDLFDRGVS
jgi:exodeoxyribonuclease V beta subunit